MQSHFRTIAMIFLLSLNVNILSKKHKKTTQRMYVIENTARTGQVADKILVCFLPQLSYFIIMLANNKAALLEQSEHQINAHSK